MSAETHEYPMMKHLLLGGAVSWLTQVLASVNSPSLEQAPSAQTFFSYQNATNAGLTSSEVD